MPDCPNCATENPERAKFCLECGAALEAPASLSDEERKVVSVLFVDLVGFTARSHDADPEDVRAAIGPYHALLKREIERFGGTVEKFIGDAVMAVFGAPVAHEDDAERAVRAALRIVEALDDLNEAQPSLDLSIRAAVNTGEVVVALRARPQAGEGMVTGDVVNTASRLQGEAPVGGVIVGEVTYRTTKGFIEYDELDTVTLKGKPEPLQVWRAISARSRFGVDVEITPTSPFVGRELELEVLKNTFNRSARESSAQLVTIIGEPGVGKTRLLSELGSFLDHEDRRVHWRQGRSLPYGEGITFWALGEIVKAQSGILDSDGPQEASDKLRVAVEAVVEESSERDWITARLGPLVGVAVRADADAARGESFTAWRRFLEEVGRHSPLVAVFEDVHWADPPMLDFIDHLVEWSSGSPMLVVCSARPELFEKHPGWGGGKANSTTITLAPLSENETARLIGALLSQMVLPAELQSALLERAGGNPLYASEFISMLGDRGLLRSNGRGLAIEAKDIPMPESIHACIAARLDTLSPERKALLHDAAVMGKVFWTGAIAHVGETDEDSVKRSLHELVRKELVRPAPKSSIQGQDEYSFRHELIRDVSYNQIPKAARGRKHRAFASWIEMIAADRVADQAEVVAHHYERAAELLGGAATPEEHEGLEASARRYLVMAGDRALNLDVARARALYERALGLVAFDDPERARVLAGLGRAAHASGDLVAAGSLYEEALPKLLAQGEALQAGELLIQLNSLAWYRAESQAESLAHLQRAIEILEREPPSVELARAYGNMGGLQVVRGHPHEGLRWAGKVLPLADLLGEQPGARQVVMEALGWLGLARLSTGDTAGIEDLRGAVHLGFELGLGDATLTHYNNLVVWTKLLDGPVVAKPMGEEALAFARRRGLLESAVFIRSTEAETLCELGLWDAALEAAEEVLEWARAQEATTLEVTLDTKIRVLVRRGDIGEAASLVPAHLSRARRLGDPLFLLPALIMGAVVARAGGDAAEAMRLLAECEPLLRTNPEVGVWELPEVARLCIAAGEAKMAARLVDGVEVQGPHQELPVRTARAIVSEASGATQEALEDLVWAAEEWGRRGSALEEGEALLGGGRCLLLLGRRGPAEVRLKDARAIFVRLGARPRTEEADRLLARATALSS